jgi:transcriptional regulator with XRE-family HTH domain
MGKNIYERAPQEAYGQARRALGWSQQKLREKSGVGISDISKIESGRAIPSPGVAARLRAALNMPKETR